jgi:hypothetical protein
MCEFGNTISVTPARKPNINNEIIVNFKFELYLCVPILSLILTSPSRALSPEKKRVSSLSHTFLQPKVGCVK